jgi:hypothetical protein
LKFHDPSRDLRIYSQGRFENWIIFFSISQASCRPFSLSPAKARSIRNCSSACKYYPSDLAFAILDSRSFCFRFLDFFLRLLDKPVTACSSELVFFLFVVPVANTQSPSWLFSVSRAFYVTSIQVMGRAKASFLSPTISPSKCPCRTSIRHQEEKCDTNAKCPA